MTNSGKRMRRPTRTGVDPNAFRQYTGLAVPLAEPVDTMRRRLTAREPSRAAPEDAGAGREYSNGCG